MSGPAFRVAAAWFAPWSAFAVLGWIRGPELLAGLTAGSGDLLIASWAALGGIVLLPAGYVLQARARRRIDETSGRSLWRAAWKRFRANRLAMIALWVMGILCVVSLLAPLLAPYDPLAIEDVTATRYQSPSFQHPFGTDEFGRDLLSRAIHGGRVSLSIGVLAMLVAMTVGTLYGAVSGYLGGWIDNALMRIVDVVLAFPTFFLLLMLVGLFQPSVPVMVLVLGLTAWTGTSRLIRAEVMALREKEFVEAARVLGIPRRRILVRHVIPNALSPLLVSATLMVGGMISAESGLSFLGIGISPPTPTWGNMVAAGGDALLVAWWMAFFPGALLAVTIICLNLIGDGLRDALDPKSLMRRFVG